MFRNVTLSWCVTIIIGGINGISDGHFYGPYVPHWYNMERCSGPKQRDISNFSAAFIKEGNNVYLLQINLTVSIEAKIEMVKIIVTPVTGDKNISQWKYKIEDPCRHPVIALTLLGLTDIKKCNILKGLHVVNLNLTSLTFKFLGNTFFYGNYVFKNMFVSKKGNIVCFSYTLNIEKKILNE